MPAQRAGAGRGGPGVVLITTTSTGTTSGEGGERAGEGVHGGGGEKLLPGHSAGLGGETGDLQLQEHRNKRENYQSFLFHYGCQHSNSLVVLSLCHIIIVRGLHSVINYVRIFTCYLTPVPLFALEMYRRLDPPPSP